jgi:DNA-binding response OmpR family regulator
MSDDEEESAIWEKDFLQEATVRASHIDRIRVAKPDH